MPKSDWCKCAYCFPNNKDKCDFRRLELLIWEVFFQPACSNCCSVIIYVGNGSQINFHPRNVKGYSRLAFQSIKVRDCPRPESGVSLMSSLYTKCCQNLYLVSEPVCSGILNNSSYVLQSPMSPVFLIPKQDQRQLGQNENKMWDCMAGVSAWICSVAANKKMQTQVGKCCKIGVKGLGQSYNRALDTNKLC